MIKFVAKTDVGKQRVNNEDSYLVKEFPEQNVSVYIVADGLGGYASGEVASSILTTTMSQYIEEHIKDLCVYDDEKVETVMLNALKYANDEIYELEKTDAKYKGMGTTVVTVMDANNTIYYLSVGDSRMYYIDEKMVNMEQITVDDTYVNELVKTNIIDAKEAENHPQKHVLTKAVGVLKKLNVGVNILDKKDGYLLLCTDGMTNMLDKKEVLTIFKKSKFEQIADKLVAKSNEKGGADNITVIVVKL